MSGFYRNDAVSDPSASLRAGSTGAGPCTNADLIKTKIRFICSFMQKNENS
jgi:hypothetical protein